MEQQGWVKSYRAWFEHPYIAKDSEYYFVWMYLLHSASFSEVNCIFEGRKTTLKKGQLLTSRGKISKLLNISDSKVKRILECFKNDQLIDQRSDRQQSLITIRDWELYQCESDQRNDQRMTNDRPTEQETENEKEKRSKREKDKEKEINKNEKNERSVCVGAHTYGHTRSNLLFLGRYENVVVDKGFYEEFKEKYWYYDKVIDKLSAYKKARNIVNSDDIPYLEQFAIEDKDKYIKPCGSSYDTFDADEAFEAALKRSYAKDDDEW